MRCGCCPKSPVGSEYIGSYVRFLSSFRDRESLLLPVPEESDVIEPFEASVVFAKGTVVFHSGSS